MVSLSVLCEKDIISISTGQNIGRADDIEFSEKTAKDTQGVAAISLKKNHKIDRVTDFVAEKYSDPHRYKTKSLPATGAILKTEDVGEQISF